MNRTTSIGLLAAACTTISFLPQAIKVIKTKHTKDLSLGMYSLLTAGLCLWFVYGVLVNDLPVILANALSLVLAVIILSYNLKYN
jgi:MtN3 and saliva related transmembrane protein